MLAAFDDIILLYPSSADAEPGCADSEEGLWVAHSTRTDQVGVGHHPFDAVKELAFAVRALLEERAKDPTVQVFQPAPTAILERLQCASPMPEPLWERLKSAITACAHHHDDESYWAPVIDDEVSNDCSGWEFDRPLFHKISEQDLCVA